MIEIQFLSNNTRSVTKLYSMMLNEGMPHVLTDLLHLGQTSAPPHFGFPFAIGLGALPLASVITFRGAT